MFGRAWRGRGNALARRWYGLLGLPAKAWQRYSATLMAKRRCKQGSPVCAPPCFYQAFFAI
ncbi:MAG: hypothetical protein HXL34_00670 [Prevotellaceae bacterium]|nr:hypothetical protein [Prevotellaceae bacterium]